MIRRELTQFDGSRHWALISQVEHARLSGELAAAWGNEQFTPVMSPLASPLREEVLAAIAHHDDGWTDWEQAPKLDPQHGRPLSFLEMPLDDSLSIWRKSILACRFIGPLAGWMVGGHFRQLLAESSSADAPSARRWMNEIDALRQDWLAEWSAGDPAHHTPSRAQTAQHWLRRFDGLSLWFCCGTSEPFPMVPAEGDDHESRFQWDATARPPDPTHETPTLRLTARAADWPFAAPQISLETDARLVPARRYTSTDEFLAALQPCRIEWQVESALPANQ